MCAEQCVCGIHMRSFGKILDVVTMVATTALCCASTALKYLDPLKLWYVRTHGKIPALVCGFAFYKHGVTPTESTQGT